MANLSNWTTILPDAGQEAVRLLESTPKLRQKIAKACGVEPNAVPELFADVLRFLACAAGHNGTITPTKTIDAAWNEFILFNRLYAILRGDGNGTHPEVH